MNEEINNIINKYYNDLLNNIGQLLIEIFNNENYYEKINNKYINKGKIKIEKFKYIKDILPYYGEFNLPFNDEDIYESYNKKLDFTIGFFTLIKTNKLKIFSKELRSELAKKLFNKIKEEKINDIIILYKLKRR